MNQPGYFKPYSNTVWKVFMNTDTNKVYREDGEYLFSLETNFAVGYGYDNQNVERRPMFAAPLYMFDDAFLTLAKSSHVCSVFARDLLLGYDCAVELPNSNEWVESSIVFKDIPKYTCVGYHTNPIQFLAARQMPSAILIGEDGYLYFNDKKIPMRIDPKEYTPAKADGNIYTDCMRLLKYRGASCAGYMFNSAEQKFYYPIIENGVFKMLVKEKEGYKEVY